MSQACLWRSSRLFTGARACTYKFKVENNNGRLRWTRQLTVDVLMLEAKHYPSLQYFFQRVRTVDGQQAVLLPPR